MNVSETSIAPQRRGPDLLDAFEPALSTTSDMPKVAPPEPPPPKALVSEEDTGETEARRRQSESDARSQAEARARAALDERFDRALTALEKAPPRTELRTQTADPRPARRDFDDPDSYEEALIRWSAQSAAKVTQSEIEKRQKDREAEDGKRRAASAQQEFHKTRLDAWGKAQEKALEKYPDYEKIAGADDLKITPAMAAAIVEENLDSGKGYEIAYYLGQHKDEAAKIAALPTVQRQQLAIGRLAERLASQAKAPPKVTKAARASDAQTVDGESMEECAKRRNAELRSRHG